MPERSGKYDFKGIFGAAGECFSCHLLVIGTTAINPYVLDFVFLPYHGLLVLGRFGFFSCRSYQT